MDCKRLKIGLLVDSLRPEPWVRRMVGELCASDHAAVSVIVALAGPSNAPSRPPWLQRVYLSLEGQARSGSAADADHRSVTDRVGGAETLGVDVLPGTDGADLAEADRVALVRQGLDVALHLGARPLGARFRGIARYGLWSLDGLTATLGLREVLGASSVADVALRVRREDPAPGVLHRVVTGTDRFSVARTRERLLVAYGGLLRRKLRDVALHGSAGLELNGAAPPPLEPLDGFPEVPGNLELLSGWGGLAVRRARASWRRRLWRRQWQLAYAFDQDRDPDRRDFGEFVSLIPPPDRIWADPFPMRHQGKHYVFFEEMLRGEKGHISVVEIGNDGTVSPPVAVLKKETHLSYPFVFRWNDAFHMLPESRADRKVELWRSHAFPGDWRQEAVLLDGVNGSDATLLEHDGRWWMFLVAAEEGQAPRDDLWLFHAPSPLGPWTPHRRNPVKSDCRSARPAGRVFEWKGDLYRPAQDCSGDYGSAVVLNRIVELSTERYDEVPVSRLTPDWDRRAVCMHTLNHGDGLSVIDVQRWISSVV